MSEDLCVKLFNDRTLADVTFVSDGNEEKAHKCVLADRCDYFKQLFLENQVNVINVDGTFFKFFKEVVKFCYLQHLDLSDWIYDDKYRVYELATAYNYGQLMDFMQRELKKRPESPLSVDTLNEWLKKSPAEELREWIKQNRLNIVNYEDCHKYTKDLILFILDTFNEMDDKERNKYKLLTVQKKLFQWLFRWRNWCHRKEEDVQSLFSKLELNFMLNERPAWEIPFRMKLSQVVHHFMWFREVYTAGLECEEVLELLCFSHVYDFGPLFDAVLNVVTTQHLKPSSLATIHGVAHQLGSSKLLKVLVDYLRNNTNSIFASANFMDYPASVVIFIFENLSGQVMDAETKSLIFSSMREWRISNNEKEVEKVFSNIQWQDFLAKLREDIFTKSFKDDDSKDVTFVIGKREIKAHKTVLGYSCNFFKQLFDQNHNNRINMDGTRIEPFTQLINHCYMQKIDLRGWGYSEKEYLYDLSTNYKYQPLMDIVKLELDKRPEVPLSLASLNQWYENSPEEKIREWVKNNLLNIVSYKECHTYNKDLVVLIMDTFCELADKATDKEKLETPMKELLSWLFRWRNSSTRKEEDVQRVFAKIRLPLVFKERALGDKTLQKKLFEAVRRFCQMREVDTAGWTCDDVLELLYFCYDYEFYPLLDAVVNTVATQYLEPTVLGKIHHLTSRLHCNKLRQILAHYIKNKTMIILTSSDFINYPASVVVFILEKLSGHAMDKKLKNQLLTSLWNWKTSKSEEDVKAVFTKIQWEDFSPMQLAAVLRVVIPVIGLADISGPLVTAENKIAKRKQSKNSPRRRSVRLRKE